MPYVVALGRTAWPFAGSSRRVSPLQSMFFALTDDVARQPAERRAPADALARIV